MSKVNKPLCQSALERKEERRLHAKILGKKVRKRMSCTHILIIPGIVNDIINKQIANTTTGGMKMVPGSTTAQYYRRAFPLLSNINKPPPPPSELRS